MKIVSALCIAAASSVLALGCYASAGTAPPPPPPAYEVTAGAAPADDYVYEAPPANIETYPVVMYEGSPHYYVNGRWYAKTNKGWAYHRNEPPALVSRRPAAPRQEARPAEPRKEEPRKEEEHH